MVEPTKKDYEQAREVWASRLINLQAEERACKAGFDFCAKKAKEAPEVEDPMPVEATK